MLETNIAKIKKLCQKKEDQNWKFRAFLKSCDLGSNEIDTIVHRLHHEVSSQIQCTDCANCCKKANFLLNDKDLERLAQGLNITMEEFKKTYIDDCTDKIGGGYTFNRLPCPFLENNRCKVYNFRPGNCHSFPYLHKKDFVFKLIQVIDNCSICPIVFNVYERLKGEIPHRLPPGGAGSPNPRRP